MNPRAVVVLARLALCFLFVNVISVSGSSTTYAARIDYEYDDAGRLKKVVHQSGTSVSYRLDAAGNRISVTTADPLIITSPGGIATEGSLLTIPVLKTGLATESISVDYQTRTETGPGYASSPADFTTVSGTLTFAPGETQKSILIPTVDDSITEPIETVFVDFTNPTGGAQLSPFSSTDGRIEDNDLEPVCSFAAQNAQGGDEFSISVVLQRTGSCSTAVTVSVSVQYLSGIGAYTQGPLYLGPTINPSDQYKILSIWPYYQTVDPNSWLRLKVTWTITSGNGSISPAESIVTICSSDYGGC